jgi:phage shock protein A
VPRTRVRCWTTRTGGSLRLLQRVWRGVADVATSRKRIEVQVDQLRQSGGKLEGHVQQALAAGREDLAREAPTTRTTVAAQVKDLASRGDGEG